MAEKRELRFREVTPPTMDGRIWEVVVLPDGITYRVMASGRSLVEAPKGTAPLGRNWSEGEIQVGIRRAIENDLASPPQKVSGQTYELNLTSYDLYDASGML